MRNDRSAHVQDQHFHRSTIIRKLAEIDMKWRCERSQHTAQSGEARGIYACVLGDADGCGVSPVSSALESVKVAWCCSSLLAGASADETRLLGGASACTSAPRASARTAAFRLRSGRNSAVVMVVVVVVVVVVVIVV